MASKDSAISECALTIREDRDEQSVCLAGSKTRADAPVLGEWSHEGVARYHLTKTLVGEHRASLPRGVAGMQRQVQRCEVQLSQ